MKRKFISVALFGALLAASTSVTTSCKDYDDDISGLQGQITANATNLDGLVNEKVNNLTQQISSLKAQEEALEAALTTAKTELAATIAEAEQGAKDYADIQAAAAQVAAIEASKTNIEEARAALQAGIDAANAAIEAVNSQVATQAGQIDALLSADAALQSAINIANGEIETAKSMAATAQSAAEAAQGTANDNAQKIAGVTEKLQTVEEGLNNQISLLDGKLNQAVADIAANKADVEAKLATVNSLVQANAEAISALQNKDAELLDKIAQNTKELLAFSEKLTALQATVEQNLTAAKAYADAQVAALKAELGADINEVRGDLAGAVARLGAAEQKISSIEEAVGALQDKDKELDEAIAAVKGNIETINGSIGAISGRVDALEGTVAVHGTDIETLKSTATTLRADLDAVKVTADEAKANIVALTQEFNEYVTKNDAALTNLENRMSSALDEKIGDMGDELRGELTSATSGLQGQINALEGDLREKYEALVLQIGAITGDDSTVGLIGEKINEVNGKISTLGTKVDNLGTDLSALTTRVSTVETEIGEINKNLAMTTAAIGQAINRFNADMAQLCTVLSTQLKSIVFSPTEYYQGIEAIAVNSYNYKAKSVGKANPAGDQKTEVPSSAWNETSVVPFVKASYHLNPSNAVVSTDKECFRYVVNNASYTRAAKASDITVDSVKQNKPGMIDVYFSMKNANNIEKISNGKVDVAALAYTYPTENNEDTVVTSDYAALKQYVITNFAINKVSKRGDMGGASHNHLATTAAAALASNTRLQITFENKDPYAGESEAEGLDLDKWINVHYELNGLKDRVWGGQEKINETKFKLEYELIGYKATDADKTSESEHATIVDGHILKVHGVDGNPGNRNIIGRKPLVRVKLVDENTNNQIAEVGYILVEITDVIVGPVAVDDIAAITNGYTVSCDNNTILDNVRAITWIEVENKILGQLNMSKEEFEANYALAVYSGTQNCKQYSDSKDDAEMLVPIGSIVNTNDPEAHETNVLKWTVGNQQAYDLFVTKKMASVSTWVKFEPKSTISSHKDVFVKLTWTPGVVNKTPVAAIENSYNHKKRADWHAENSRNEGFAELHIQVGNATDPNATCEYASMVVANTFNKQPVDIIKDAIRGTYPALANEAVVAYKFAPAHQQAQSGGFRGVESNYRLTVESDGSKIYANNNLLATIEASDGTITMADNAIVKDIINYYKESLADALTFTVIADESTCAPAKDLITFNNNKFNVKVIKPMFVTGGSIAPMTLNDYSTLTQKLSLNFEDFNSYDPQEFWDKSNQNKSFWDFYEVTNIENVEVKTNYSGAIKDVDPNEFTVTFTQPKGAIRLDNMGSVTLEQKNMSRANSFEVYMKFKVTYKWGYLYQDVTLKVNNAPGKRSLNR